MPDFRDSRNLKIHLQVLASQYAKRLREALENRLISVALFGSVARGETSPHSGIGLFIVLERLRKRPQAPGTQRKRTAKIWYRGSKPNFQPGEVIEL